MHCVLWSQCKSQSEQAPNYSFCKINVWTGQHSCEFHIKCHCDQMFMTHALTYLALCVKWHGGPRWCNDILSRVMYESSCITLPWPLLHHPCVHIKHLESVMKRFPAAFTSSCYVVCNFDELSEVSIASTHYWPQSQSRFHCYQKHLNVTNDKNSNLPYKQCQLCQFPNATWRVVQDFCWAW